MKKQNLTQGAVSIVLATLLLGLSHLSLIALAAPPIEQKGELQEVIILVDDFEPQPRQGQVIWPHNRLGGDRGPLNVENGQVEWGQGLVTATITRTITSSTGVWTSLNHPIRDCTPLNFGAIFPPQIKPEYQGYITGLRIHIKNGQGIFQVVLQKGEDTHCYPQSTVFTESVALTGGIQTLQFSLPSTLTVGNLNWKIIGDAGAFVVVDRVELIGQVPQLEMPARAFFRSYTMLLANWDPVSGLTRDHAYYAAGEFDNISASGMQAAAAVVAWRLGFITKSSATDIVSRTTQALLNLPYDSCGSKLWPHFVENGQIISGTEWSSIDTVLAIVSLIEAEEALDLDPTAVEGRLVGPDAINWEALLLTVGEKQYLKHGYRSGCQPLQEGEVEAIWKDFGAESWLVNFGYTAATGKVAAMDTMTPTYNGSGFIDELAWLLAPVPVTTDTFGIQWQPYRQQAVDCQLMYYNENLTPGCKYHQNHPYYEANQLFGLSAAEVPDLSLVPLTQQVTQTYQAFGVGGVISPNDGLNLDWLGHAVIVPHYAGMAASLRPTAATTVWDWFEARGLFTPLNNVESSMCLDHSTCAEISWNDLKGSWNLSLQTLGWGRLLLGNDYPLFQGMWANDLLRSGYLVISDSCSYSPTNSFSSATHNLDHTAADWGVFCEGTPLWAKENVAQPSRDGQSLRCGILGGDPYSNVHCYRNLLPEPLVQSLTLTLSFLITPTTTCNNQGSPSTVQALEFTMNKWHQSRRYELALQWQNVGPGGPQWRYWDPSQPAQDRWVPIQPTINQCLSAEVWHTFTLRGEIKGDKVYYKSFTIDQDTHVLNLSVPTITEPGEADRLAIAVQLDGNATQDPYELFIDQVNFIRQADLYLPMITKS